MKTAVYEHKVQYYETDCMQCVHHSNYIRWFEEARCDFLDKMGFGYAGLEAAGIVSPVLQAQAEYRSMTRFGETVEMETFIRSYTGVKIAFDYTVRDRETGELRCKGFTEHCFLNENGRPVMLRKACPEMDALIRKTMEG